MQLKDKCKYALLIVNGCIKDIQHYKNIIDKAYIVVCSDGGANFIVDKDIVVNYIIGDMDSISNKTLEYFKMKNVIIKKYPAKKDKTDSELAIDIISEQKINEIVMIGAFGDRFDHILSNINLLHYANNIGISMSILDEKNEITLLNRGKHYIDVKIGQIVSFIGMTGEVKGITLKGFEYELCNYNLKTGSSILTSNVAEKERVYVEIKDGSLLCIKVNE